MFTECEIGWALAEKAVWNVANVAMFDTATLKVTDGGFILLRQIIFNHFCDVAGGERTIGDVLKRSIHGVSLCEQGSNEELYYNFRSPVNVVSDGSGGFIPIVLDGPSVVETFKIFKKNVCIDISCIQDVKDFSLAAGKMNVNSEERNVPVGFGVTPTGVAITGIVTFPAPDSGKYFPNGDKRTIAGTNPLNSGAHYRDQFRNPNNANTKLNPAPANTSQGRQNIPPFISFGYWRISGDPKDFLTK